MKVRVSYFYQIRNFKPNMIPMSTALSDPKWYHDFKGPQHIFTDKRGIINGLRLLPIIVQGGGASCPCEDKNPNNCPFVKDYELALEFVDFNSMLKGMEDFCNMYCQKEKITEEPIAVLMVHEAPNNPCSERYSLIKYFNKNGIECKELDYPIQRKETAQIEF